MATAELTAQRLRELLHYDPQTGVFTWRAKASANTIIGKEAGYKSPTGYREIQVDKVRCFAHRLAWFYMTGSWPSYGIDHINGDPSDNRFDNLRDVPQIVNLQNKKTAMRNNKVGLLGVFFIYGKFYSTISIRGKRARFGPFAKAQDAHTAYLIAKRELHEGCTI